MREFVYKVEYHFSRQPMSKIKELVSDHSTTLIEIINDAASAYKGVIPDDRWKEPYMSANELSDEIRAGVRFYGWFKNSFLLGIDGIQNVGSIDLIRPLLRVYCLPETRHRQRPATTPAESRADFHDFGWHVGRRTAGSTVLSAIRIHVGFAGGERRAPARVLEQSWRQIETSGVLKKRLVDGVNATSLSI